MKNALFRNEKIKIDTYILGLQLRDAGTFNASWHFRACQDCCKWMRLNEAEEVYGPRSL